MNIRKVNVSPGIQDDLKELELKGISIEEILRAGVSAMKYNQEGCDVIVTKKKKNRLIY